MRPRSLAVEPHLNHSGTWEAEGTPVLLWVAADRSATERIATAWLLLQNCTHSVAVIDSPMPGKGTHMPALRSKIGRRKHAQPTLSVC